MALAESRSKREGKGFLGSRAWHQNRGPKERPTDAKGLGPIAQGFKRLHNKYQSKQGCIAATNDCYDIVQEAYVAFNIIALHEEVTCPQIVSHYKQP